ncbi:hypothetical protein BDA99DRAFT_535558 [Phascolomyces articulosus]|uniref:Uncharacterized protein n=1 Tax=Phascolomyces articulosus TaxID=60185 RepID=A0AAD5PFS7_9FUNG|nr:hypothetical protein BDA99DRAFT_535558 [Phascolomyces articulosus]
MNENYQAMSYRAIFIMPISSGKMHLLPSLTFLAFTLVGFQLFSSPVLAVNVTKIDDCPALSPRTGVPKDATDVRADDIKVIAAMGDSIMAGFGMMGSSSIIDTSSFREYRGQSYGIGGDSDAQTMATFTRHFSPDLVGPSLGERSVSLCLTIMFKKVGIFQFGTNTNICFLYTPAKLDGALQHLHLNGAVSGATASSLSNQLDYLIPKMKSLSNDFENDWKLVNIQIGSNDQCASCGLNALDVTAARYGSYVSAAVKRIVENVPNVIVNLIGVFHVSPVYNLTAGQSYCNTIAGQPLNRNLCGCFQGTSSSRRAMDALADSYNDKLIEIYQSYQGKNNTGFGVTYQPNNINIAGFPLEAMSNADCFHPSLISHQWISKIAWNNLFTPRPYKPSVHNFNKNQEILCPGENDRIII